MRDYRQLHVPEAVWQNPLYFIGFGFGSGAMPFAPGTFGTLLAIPFYLILRQMPLSAYVIVVIGLTLASIWLCERLSKEIAIHDHPGMCVDEFIGFFVAMINAPHKFFYIVLGFALFRFFDIVKPWPICLIDEKVKGGVGMILDDILAGVYTFIIIQVISWIY